MTLPSAVPPTSGFADPETVPPAPFPTGPVGFGGGGLMGFTASDAGASPGFGDILGAGAGAGADAVGELGTSMVAGVGADGVTPPGATPPVAMLGRARGFGG